MLQVGIDYPEQVRVGVLPTVNHSTRETALSLAHEHMNSLIVSGVLVCDLRCAIGAVVIDNDDFVVGWHRLHGDVNAVEQNWNVSSLVESGDDKTKFVTGMIHSRGPETVAILGCV
jgi:hypothetical protein